MHFRKMHFFDQCKVTIKRMARDAAARAGTEEKRLAATGRGLKIRGAEKTHADANIARVAGLKGFNLSLV